MAGLGGLGQGQQASGMQQGLQPGAGVGQQAGFGGAGVFQAANGDFAMGSMAQQQQQQQLQQLQQQLIGLQRQQAQQQGLHGDGAAGRYGYGAPHMNMRDYPMQVTPPDCNDFYGEGNSKPDILSQLAANSDGRVEQVCSHRYILTI